MFEAKMHVYLEDPAMVVRFTVFWRDGDMRSSAIGVNQWNGQRRVVLDPEVHQRIQREARRILSEQTEGMP